MESDKIEKLGETRFHKKETDDNKKAYLSFNQEELVEYIQRKAAICRNELMMFFPLSLLSCFNALVVCQGIL